MNALFRNMVSRLITLLAACALAFAPGGVQAQPAYPFSQQELDQMLAPIALYPDGLLSQILMAATYPLEVIEAAHWAGARPDLSGDEAVRAAEAENWDPSVKSLLAFPQVLARMGENPQWTQALGDAFLDQQAQVMDAVQALRRKAQRAGNLRSDERMNVVESGPNLLLQAFDPQAVSVPYYDPLVVYGSWWWPAYPPVYLRPWPGYYARPAYARNFFYWGPPVRISAGVFFGGIDWRRRQLRVEQGNHVYYNKLATLRQANLSPQLSVNRAGAWRHDPEHRRGLAYRGVDAQLQFGAARTPDRGNQTRAADARRPNQSMDARADALFEARRSDARTGAQLRPDPQAAQPARAEVRIEGRQPEVRTGALSARDTTLARPVGIIRGESRPEWHPKQQLARAEPRARIEAPRAPQPRMEIRPVQNVARRESTAMAVARNEPVVHHAAPPMNAARAEIRPAQAVSRQGPGAGAKAMARPRMGP